MQRTRSGPTRSNLAKLTLTAIPVRFNAEHVAGGRLTYESKNQLDNLRFRYSATHTFHRAGDSILTVPITTGANHLGEAALLSVKENGLASRLVREALVRHFDTLPYRRASRRYSIELLVNSRDLVPRLHSSFTEGGPEGVCLYQLYEFDVRLLHPRNHDPLCVVALDTRIRPILSLSAEDLLRRGIDLEGKYVAAAADGKLLGRVTSVQGSTLFLQDSRNRDSAKASECVLEPRVDNFLMCLSQISGIDEKNLRACFDQVNFGITGAEGKAQFVERFTKHLESVGKFTAASEATFEFGKVIQTVDYPGFPLTRIPRPSFVFHPTGNKTHRLHDDGLNLHGPFDTESFSKKAPRIAVVTPRRYQGRVEQFLREFKNGIASSKRFQKGFVRKYHLEDCQFEIHSFEEGGSPGHSYREACLDAINSGSYDLAIVVIREEFHSFNAATNPYLVTKSALMSQGVPVQEVEIETIEGRGIQYILNNLALACYGKLGGIPFTILAPPPVAHEIIVGLGSVNLSEERLSSRSRIVGISTVFNADGNYLLSNVAKEVPYEQYMEELKASLATCIDDISKRNAWQEGDKLRLVFHVFKPLKDSEAQAVKSFVESLTDYDVRFAFLTFSDNHPFTMLDANQQGVNDFESKMNKGKLVPERGWALRTGSREILLALTGPTQLKTSYQGCPKPVLIRLHRESTFDDLTYLAQQAYNFTFLSWRSLSPGSLPVTISYSQLIGRLLGQLSGLPNWNPDMLRTHLKTSRWFL